MNKKKNHLLLMEAAKETKHLFNQTSIISSFNVKSEKALNNNYSL